MRCQVTMVFQPKRIVPMGLVLAMLASGAGAQQGMPRPAVNAAPAGLSSPAGNAVAAPTPGMVDSRYVIGPEDNLQVTVWKEPGLSGTLPVRPDGMISLSLVGDLPAAGSTPMQLSSDISERLKKFVNDPSVTVTVLSVHPKQVYLLGEVMHVGAIPLVADMSPLQAIATAGGLSPYANTKHVYILRGDPGHQKKITFDYKKALKDGNGQGVSLLPGDTIVVP